MNAPALSESAGRFRETGQKGGPVALSEDIDTVIKKVLDEGFSVTDRTTDVVPDPAEMSYSTGIKMHATYLYSDMADSTKLINFAPAGTIAAVLRMYLETTVRVIRAHGGHIRSFDGDRVMGVFAGAEKADRAVKAAMKLNFIVKKRLHPALVDKYKSIREGDWSLHAVSGIATNSTTMIRVGIRNNNDLVSIGIAPNLAARLSEQRQGSTYGVFLGAGTYKALTDVAKLSDGVNMWDGPYDLKMGDGTFPYYRTKYWWKV